MERLTIPDQKIGGVVRRSVIDARKVKEHAMTIYWALKKYEDTGLTPEQIRELKECMNDGWIPVEERLPEDETMMLVTCQTKAGRRSVNRAWYGAGCWHGTGSMSGVTAWMPLPDPYSPERSTNEKE